MFVVGISLHAQTALLPTDFFIVSEVISDASPFWYHYILHVTAAGHDSLVRYIRIAPMDTICPESITVKAATVTLHDVQPADIVSAYHICDVDSQNLNTKLQRLTHTAAIDDSVRYGIVASCGAKDVVIHLPYPEQVKLEGLRKKSSKLASWWELEESARQRAFGSGDVFYGMSPEEEDHLQREGESVIGELRSGRFDKGLQSHCKSGSCKPPSFADELRSYVGRVGSHGNAPKLTQATQYRFKKYVDPKYPALAMQARIQGIVRFNLLVDPITGSVREVDIVLGHPLFRDAVTSAARQWQFESDGFGSNSQSVPAELVFEFHCPRPIDR